MSDIIWTKTDEAPLFASYSLFPIVKSFLSRAGISITRADISLAGRILSLFSKELGLNKADGRAYQSQRGKYHQATKHLSHARSAKSGDF